MVRVLHPRLLFECNTSILHAVKRHNYPYRHLPCPSIVQNLSFADWKRQLIRPPLGHPATFSTNSPSQTHNKSTSKIRRQGTFESVWEQRFQQLKAFRDQHGHCRVPSAKTGEYSQLYTWIENQRRAYKKIQQQQQQQPSTANSTTHKQKTPRRSSSSSLVQSRLDRLQDELGLDLDPRATQWQARYADLLDFVAHYGHCRVPDQYSPNPELGRWVRTQRYQYHLQEPFSNLTPERRYLLEQLDFCWDVQQENWMDYWKKYMEEKEKNKRKLLQRSIQSKSSQNNDGDSYNDDDNNQESEIIDSPPDDEEDNYDDPAFFQQQQTSSSKISEASMKRWVRGQRYQFQLYRQGKVSQHSLTPDRIDRLKQAGIIGQDEDDDPYAPQQVDDE